ncbi:MAG: prepilin-type N-terminal cleavage/methylation domain-containing protein [Patescibacteria group bacterium]|nr:prepilin-type N-terminal cleavage/methylation domain-containing protein [Patescibacteria group bacterium]
MNRTNIVRKAKGFTLIEVLLVIAIIAILASIVIIAINPARQIAQANNAQRRSNVNTILNAVHQYAIDHRGALPTTVSTTASFVCQTGAAVTTTCTDLSVLTNDQLYIASLPIDPSTTSTVDTGYRISKSTSTNARITVTAPYAELEETISVLR